MRRTCTLALVIALGACGPRVRPPPPPPPLAPGEAPAIRRIEPGVLRGLMVAGALRVEPDDALAGAIAAHGDRPLLAIVTVCLDADGNASGVLRRPSEVPAFDQAALEVVKRWRFRPYVDGGAPAPACALAAFRHGRAVTPDGSPAPADWNDALPAAEIELPRAEYLTGGIHANHSARRATPGVAIARLCRDRGSRAAPHLWWLQSSGDPVLDRELFDRRVTIPAGERGDGQHICWVRSQIVLDPAPAEPTSTRKPSVASERLAAVRISGDKMIFPSSDLRIAILRSPWPHELRAVVQICVDEIGRPAWVTVVESSGWAGYDMDLVNTVATWRYRPFVVDGIAAPACGLVTFAYRQS